MEESRGSASSPTTGMAVVNTIEGLFISIFGVDPRVVSLGPYHHGEDHVTLSQMEESRGIASSPAVRDPIDQEWSISMFGEDDQQPDPEPRPKHRIPKVPTKFLKYEENKKYFDPQVVSLGPYHHDDEHLKPMEKHKITAVKQFLDESRRRIFYEKVKELTERLKEFYDADVVADMSDDVFARMMLLDGCFVLHFIENINEREKTKLNIPRDQIRQIIRDMFLMENQLPFEVLDALMKLLWGSDNSGKAKILKFIKRKVLFPMGFSLENSSRSSNWCRARDSPLHLLDILRTVLLDFPPSWGTKKESYRPHNFGSVMELKAFGIRFERRNMKSLMGISFKEHFLFQRLLLPKLVINDTTISQLLNLTALEACSDTYSGCGVTSFIHFMDTLINDDADVKKLGSKGILHHTALGGDDEVARLFNTWPADVTNNLRLFSTISWQIRQHRDKRLKISIATWVDHYFGSPLKTISILGAGLLLVLTVIQTYLAAFPRG